MLGLIKAICAIGFLPAFLLTCEPPEALVTPASKDCDGTEFEGAWFTAIIPQGMEVHPSRVEPKDGGVLSAWLETQDGLTEFYLFSPQWGGVPYDIFVGAKSREEMIESDSPSRSIVKLKLVYEDKVGRYSMDQSTEPVSHLTVGYRTKGGELSQSELENYNCFVNSIQQFTD